MSIRVGEMELGIPNTSPRDTWDCLESDADAQLIDVRTEAEWTFVGCPDLSSIGKSVIFAQWSSFPGQRVEPTYGERLDNVLSGAGLNKTSPLFFICRSGVRSLAAAQAMAERGFAACHNVADGFEGPLDTARRRGRIAGWKVSGLPWIQS